MFGFKTNKTLRKELVNQAWEYDQTRAILIRRTTELQKQERKANEVQADVEKVLGLAGQQRDEIKELARIIIQASRNQGMEEFCTTADSLCERFPDLAPQPEAPDPKAGD